MRRLRQPAVIPALPAAARPHVDDPSASLVAMFEQVWRESMHDMPFVNLALKVEAIGFRRYQGEWFGAVVTPWFLNLFLLPGGGGWWQDLPTGEQRTLEFPVGSLAFIADNNPDVEAVIAAYQYCPLLHPVHQLADPAAARAAAEAALCAVFAPPAVDESQQSPGQAKMPKEQGAPLVPARRVFLGGAPRRLG